MKIIIFLTFILINIGFSDAFIRPCIPGDPSPRCKSDTDKRVSMDQVVAASILGCFGILTIFFIYAKIDEYLETPEQKEERMKRQRRIQRERLWKIDEEERRIKRLERMHEKAEREYQR